jgi:ribosome-associated heat shock protein Hsp15
MIWHGESLGENAAERPAAGQRIDKWLWVARFFKTRGAAAALCAEGKIRMSGRVISKAHVTVRVGDVLTFPLGRYIRVVKVRALAQRRGPAAEARTLYDDLNPVPGPGPEPVPGSLPRSDPMDD